MEKGISVIVCCYNSANRLSETLKHLLRQHTSSLDWEIIVVDNASTDYTATLAAEKLGEELPPEKYKVVQEINPGLSNARRKGYFTSKYTYLLFCDDDNWLEENYLQLAFDTMEQNNRIGILGGTGEAVFEKQKPFWFDKYQINFAVGKQSGSAEIISKTESVYGAGIVVQRKIFETLDALQFESLLSDRKGNQLVSGGDTELCLVTGYLGYDICCSTGLRFKHLMTEGRMNWDYLKKLYYGFGKMRLYLHAYKRLEHSNVIPGKNLRLPLWLDKFLHKLGELSYYIPYVFFHENEEGNDTMLKYFALKGELKELWTLKGNYSDIFYTIHALKIRIAELPNKVTGQK